MKAMRRRIALQKHFVRNSAIVFYFRERCDRARLTHRSFAKLCAFFIPFALAFCPL
jgi:hypothetical protein